MKIGSTSIVCVGIYNLHWTNVGYRYRPKKIREDCLEKDLSKLGVRNWKEVVWVRSCRTSWSHLWQGLPRL